jgi:cob(I)alamin adenosyltransferase
MNTIAPAAPPWPRGLVQVYTGDGKGKTTAALGLALRAVGWGYPVFIGQFMKAQDTGELRSAAVLTPLLTIEQFGQPDWVSLGDPSAEDLALTQRGLARIRAVLAAGEHRVVIMDEICVAVGFKLARVEEVLEIIAAKPLGVELVLTGRRAPAEIVAVADLVSEVCEVKHPYQQGIPARQGIEF